MERDQKLVIHCASKGDFHSPRASSGRALLGVFSSSGNRNYVLTLRSQRFDGGQRDHEGAHGSQRHISTLDQGLPCPPPPPPVPRVGQAQKWP